MADAKDNRYIDNKGGVHPVRNSGNLLKHVPNSHGQELDGKGQIKPTPFDAHEQATRGTHVPTTKDSPDLDPKKVAEYPKAVDHVDHPSGVGKRPVIVKNAQEEREYKERKAKEAKSTASDSAASS